MNKKIPLITGNRNREQQTSSLQIIKKGKGKPIGGQSGILRIFFSVEVPIEYSPKPHQQRLCSRPNHSERKNKWKIENEIFQIGLTELNDGGSPQERTEESVNLKIEFAH
ncbi:hypothetical protein [Mangrovibacterium diazotrophicum]|uniref:hypothetical protein n=1 Tax=Mangrovibacterium diazotrophicum TaxID=1261403 RepID=UPI000E75B317|nr:hypothetical protein [Mangrovibacterium diazotrophicum]